MRMKEIPSQEHLLEVFDYDAETGTLLWKPRIGEAGCIKSFNSRFAGKPALNAVSPDGYRRGCLEGVYRTGHRVIWKMIHGDDPNVIDHIDGDRSNNRIGNLRSVSHSENRKNSKKRKDNKSGVTGVYFLKRERKWGAEVFDNGKKINLGQFSTLAEASDARKKMAATLNYSSRHGA